MGAQQTQAPSAGVPRKLLEDGPRPHQRQVPLPTWLQVAPGHGEFTGEFTPSPTRAAGRRKPHEGAAAGAGAVLESSPSTPWHWRGPILPLHPPMGQNRAWPRCQQPHSPSPLLLCPRAQPCDTPGARPVPCDRGPTAQHPKAEGCGCSDPRQPQLQVPSSISPVTLMGESWVRILQPGGQRNPKPCLEPKEGAGGL